MRISIHISLLANMYDFQGKTCPCIESVRAGFGKKGLEATVGLLQGPGNVWRGRTLFAGEAIRLSLP